MWKLVSRSTFECTIFAYKSVKIEAQNVTDVQNDGPAYIVFGSYL